MTSESPPAPLAGQGRWRLGIRHIAESRSVNGSMGHIDVNPGRSAGGPPTLANNPPVARGTARQWRNGTTERESGTRRGGVVDRQRTTRRWARGTARQWRNGTRACEFGTRRARVPPTLSEQPTAEGIARQRRRGIAHRWVEPPPVKSRGWPTGRSRRRACPGRPTSVRHGSRRRSPTPRSAGRDRSRRRGPCPDSRAGRGKTASRRCARASCHPT